jgi:predicted GIY-YIG superfamily endonuclease
MMLSNVEQPIPAVYSVYTHEYKQMGSSMFKKINACHYTGVTSDLKSRIAKHMKFDDPNNVAYVRALTFANLEPHAMKPRPYSCRQAYVFTKQF